MGQQKIHTFEWNVHLTIWHFLYETWKSVSIHFIALISKKRTKDPVRLLELTKMWPLYKKFNWGNLRFYKWSFTKTLFSHIMEIVCCIMQCTPCIPRHISMFLFTAPTSSWLAMKSASVMAVSVVLTAFNLFGNLRILLSGSTRIKWPWRGLCW